MRFAYLQIFPKSFLKLSTQYSILSTLLFLLAACNLGTTPPVTPTVDTDQPPDATAVPSQLPALPTLPPPPQLLTPLATVQVGAGTPTVVPLGGGTPILAGTGVATLNAALADDRYEIQVRAGKTFIGVSINLTLVTGTVALTLQGPTGVVWQKTFTASENSRAEVPITQGGMYEVLVDIANFDGNYSLSWD